LKVFRVKTGSLRTLSIVVSSISCPQRPCEHRLRDCVSCFPFGYERDGIVARGCHDWLFVVGVGVVGHTSSLLLSHFLSVGFLLVLHLSTAQRVARLTEYGVLVHLLSLILGGLRVRPTFLPASFLRFAARAFSRWLPRAMVSDLSEVAVVITLVQKLEKLGVFDRQAFVFEQEMKRREKRRSRHKRPDRQINLAGRDWRMCPFRFGARPWQWANRSTRF
jgi:hypothetical protein